MEYVHADVDRKGITGTVYDVRADAPTTQLAVAEAALSREIAQMLAYGVAADVDEAGIRGTYPDYAARARNQVRTAQAIVHARQAIRTLMSIQGSDALTEDSPLQRIWRDSEVASRHAICNPAISAQVYGRGLLGNTDNLMSMV
jgi:alkylation response protein AidB-like acyl-CoA dehydrogenase